jgi:3',5'-nucleoside bisphosphate phosphatase
MKWQTILLTGGFAAQLFVLPAVDAQQASVRAQEEPVPRTRTPVQLPNPPGFVTLKCDFHMHTVFSDGLVWPTVRVEEAWRQGLDAIAITDHIESQRYRADVSTNHNRSYEIASALGADLNILVIRGGEVTRQMPPGHLNAIFLTNVSALAIADWSEALQIAKDQGAFIFWNHPGWDRQLKDGKIRWYPEHTQLHESGLMHGVEIVNEREHYPEAYRWAIDKKLTLLGNSDIHSPINQEYYVHERDIRPLTLVFARERTIAGIKEALFDRRTAVLWAGRFMGEERFLRPLFDGSIEILNPEVTVTGRGRVLLQVHNNSSTDFILERIENPADLSISSQVTLPAQKTVLLDVTGRGNPSAGTRRVNLPYRVRNMLTAPDEPLRVNIGVEIRFVP